MTRRDRLIFWFALLAVLLLAVFLLRDVLLPFVAGMAIAYFLDPVVDRTEKLGLSRTLGTFVVLTLFFVLAISSLLLLVPVVEAQLIRFLDVAPAYLERIETLLRPLLEKVRAQVSEDAMSRVPALAGQVFAWLPRIIEQLVSGGAAIANLLSLIFITPIVAFYLLRDWDHMIAKVDSWLPRAQAATIREQVDKIDQTLASFVRGQGMVCLVLGGFYAVTLSLAGLQFGVVIGLFSGLISFVPLAGALMGGVLSVGLALLQFSDWQPVAIILAIYVVGQVVEGNFLTPNLVGEAVGLHPVWVVFSLLAGGALFGFVGVLLAVPVTAVVGVLTRFALERYMASSLHLHGLPTPESDSGQSESGQSEDGGANVSDNDRP
jgi:predicted PurR-regulated permease PerM